jgi:hypothetical protein
MVFGDVATVRERDESHSEYLRMERQSVKDVGHCWGEGCPRRCDLDAKNGDTVSKVSSNLRLLVETTENGEDM